MTFDDLKQSNDSVFKEDEYPTPEEVAQALEDSRVMNENMIKFGTIDKPKGEQ